MKTIYKYMLLSLSVLAAVSCIENDLSYPDIDGKITALELEGQKSVTIDDAANRIDIVMGETADMAKVKVEKFEYTEEAEVVGGVPEFMDLRDSVKITLRVYEDFVWTVRAVQPIERYVRCENQAGDAEFDPEKKIVYVYVNENQDLSKVKFKDMKLEPEGSVVKTTVGYVTENGKTFEKTEECSFPGTPMILDCVVVRYFDVEYKGEDIRWTVKVLHKAVEVGVESVTPWACFAVLKGVTNGRGTAVVEYRKASDSEWTRYEDIEVSGTKVSAVVKGLAPETDYVIRLSNGEVSSSERTFTTEASEQLENMNFDNWYQDGKVWMPNAGPGVQIWDTANPGSAAVGVSPTTPETEMVVGGKAARLETKMVNILGIKKLAAGNIYTGKFDKLAGLGAELDWGVPFGARPIALRGYYKYSPVTIDVAEDKDYKDMLGKMDECQIQIFLAEWDKPFHVNSAKKLFVDKDDKSIIAFSEFCSSDANSEYVRFTLPIVYNDNRIPNYIIISGCASHYGNYFVGGVGSLLFIDEFELVYDPSELTEEEFDAVFSKMN